MITALIIAHLLFFPSPITREPVRDEIALTQWGSAYIGVAHNDKAGTAMYQAGVDIRTIQELLGHQKLETTMIYVHILGGAAVHSPLDRQLVPPVIRRVLVES